ncbi:hypothetical protein [Aquirhabdus parva]|uniref:Uncharacterized protein n=1 Tax=Aquirhabdus parva TaxID=2283318 RepID=A0A345P979_9GAMM|nr:hypothetical protein [Aquirhabdus parva]AXI03838.1 hypothetical protein HYN46_13940 [Aquirhabdus parva]
MGSNTRPTRFTQPFELTGDRLNVLPDDQQPYLGGAVYPRGQTYEDEARPDTTYAQPLRKRMYLSATPNASNPIPKASKPLSTAKQLTVSGGGALVIPGLGLGSNYVLGLNLDGPRSSLYAQTQANSGKGYGLYAGLGTSAGVTLGDAPTSGVARSKYAEFDAGYGPSASISATQDENGNINSGSIAFPHKKGIGQGFGAGGFTGQSGTVTFVTPTLEDVSNQLHSIGDRVRDFPKTLKTSDIIEYFNSKSKRR